jgi:hypothetical protein
MRAHSSVFLRSANALVLASCGTGGPVISGRTQEISVTDIQAAVAAYQASIWHGPAHVGEIEVISHNEIHIHDDPAPSSYTSMVRAKGKWHVGSVVLVHPRY